MLRRIISAIQDTKSAFPHLFFGLMQPRNRARKCAIYYYKVYYLRSTFTTPLLV